MLDMLGLLVTCSIIVAFGAYVAGPSGFGFTFVMCAWFFLYTLSGRRHQSKKETYQGEVECGKRKKEWIRLGKISVSHWRDAGRQRTG